MSFLKRIGSMRKTSYNLSKRGESSTPYDNKSNIHCLVLLLDGTLLTCDIDVSFALRHKANVTRNARSPHSSLSHFHGMIGYTMHTLIKF